MQRERNHRRSLRASSGTQAGAVAERCSTVMRDYPILYGALSFMEGYDGDGLTVGRDTLERFFVMSPLLPKLFN
ncbi:hypothetical protein J27TS7_40670 [Paenibacillus dendritiformis]|nr:hypothetical protein J27TS7_40670 [Paenibacillus dendritiformis]